MRAKYGIWKDNGKPMDINIFASLFIGFIFKFKFHSDWIVVRGV
jgi:hypothetical protein